MDPELTFLEPGVGDRGPQEGRRVPSTPDARCGVCTPLSSRGILGREQRLSETQFPSPLGGTMMCAS